MRLKNLCHRYLYFITTERIFLAVAFLFLCLIVPRQLPANNEAGDNRLLNAEPSGWFSDAAIASADSRAKDEEALVALFNATNGHNWDNKTGWNGTSMSLEDNIFGVEVEEIGGELRVVLIRLNNNGTGDPKNNPLDNQGNNLTGTLPNELGNLKELRHFNVMSNDISGELPGGMRYCTKIEKAYFELTKSPSPGAYSNHAWNETLSPQKEPLSGIQGKQSGYDQWPHNNFSGRLPGEWSDWTAIHTLGIASTTIDSNGEATIEGITGPLPPEWGQWSTIVQIFMDNNKIQGGLPAEWAGMTELVDLFLAVNQLGSQTQGHSDAQLPAEWGGGTAFGDGMRKLRTLNLDIRMSGGDFDDYFGGQWTNTFDGPIPENWGNMKMWHRLYLPTFNTRHNFPAFLESGDYENRLWGNDLDGDPDPDARPVEAWMPGLTQINNINNMTNIPDPSNLSYLSVFGGGSAGDNFYDQQLPSNLNDWDRTKQFFINNTGLYGPFPDIPDWSNCKIFNVAGNNFDSPLPEVDVNGSEWRNVQANNAGFTGQIPSSWNFPGSNGFFRLWLHDNNLSGPIPELLADPGHSYSEEFRVDGNRYVFRDLVPFIALGPNNFRYAPQQAFGAAATRYVSAGASVTIDDFTSVVGHSGNRYQWKKDGAALSGATSRTLSLSALSSADQGTYTLVVTNPGAPDLTLTSKPIELVLGDGSNSDGDTGGDNTGDGSVLAAPVQVSPVEGENGVSTTLTFSWTSVDADEYILHVSRTNVDGPEEFFYSDKEGITITGTEITLSTATLPDMLHSWRVRGVKDGVQGEWSTIRQFTTGSGSSDPEPEPEPLDTPSLLQPSANSTGVSITPHFEWSSVEADSFYFQIDRLNNTVRVADRTVSGTTLSLQQELEYVTDYRWRVKAVKDGVESAWSSYGNFRTTEEPLSAPGVPELVSPANSATGVSTYLSLNWNPVEEGESYRLEVSKSANFGALVTDLSGLTETSVDLEALEYQTVYFWRVKAVNSAGQSNWSEVYSFTTRKKPLSPPAKPQVSSPADGREEAGLNLVFSWNDVSGAETYRLQISEANNPYILTTDIQNINTNSYQFKGLKPETTYLWKVQAQNGAGAGQWSETRSFTTEPDAPALLSPSIQAEDLVELTPTFEWSERNADHYILQVKMDGSSPDVLEVTVIDEPVSDTLFTPSSSLRPATEYHWRVKAVRGTIQGDWSPYEVFTTGGEVNTGNQDEAGNKESDTIATSIKQNYPNPFNPTTQIRFSLGEAQRVSLKVYDTTGRLVATLVEEVLQAGSYEQTFRADNLSSGIYFVRLITKNRVLTNQMTLIK